MQLYINDQLTDLSDDSPIALTFQINNLAEVKNQQGNTSNQFKLPLTQRNRQILGFPDDVAFCTPLPYQQYQARVIEEGLEIVPYGVAVLNSVEQDTANITVLSGNVDFFDAIDGKLYDMGDGTSTYGMPNLFAPFEHTWSIQNIAASQTNTDGWIWPVVDYGKISADIKTTPLQIDVRYLRPGFFLKTAIGLLAKLAGYKIDPNSSLLKSDLYNKLIVQFANDSFQHGTDFQNAVNNLSVIAGNPLNQSINGNGDGPNNGSIIFSSVQAADTHLFLNNQYMATTPVTIGVGLDYAVQVIDTTPAGGGSVPYIEIRIVKYSAGGSSVVGSNAHQATSRSGGGFLGHHNGAPVEYPKQKLSADIELLAGERIGIEYALWPGKERIRGTFYQNAIFTLTNKQTDVVYGQQVQCERIFPDISMKDLLKDTLQHFGIICQTDNATRTITFASFADIVKNIPVARDWTAKCLDQGKTVAYQLGGYAQINNMLYKADDNVVPKGFADSQITVADKTLAATATMLESQFAPTLNRPYINGTIAVINKVDTTSNPSSTEFSVSTQPRLLIDQKFDLREAGGRQINFTDGVVTVVVNDTISTPYFYKSDGEHSLLWDDLRKLYYPELEKILQQTKKVVRYFLLTPRDILELNLLIPVYLQQDGCYYYINKIDAWRSGQPCKVELVKLG